MRDGEPRPALIIGNDVCDITLGLGECGALDPIELADAANPYAIADFASSHLGLLRQFEAYVTDTLARNQTRPDWIAGSLGGIQLMSPILRPSKILGVGLNYLGHVAELGVASPVRPFIFAKLPSAIIGPYDNVVVPWNLCNRLDYEVELAVVIGRRGKGIAEADALDHVLGYAVANDLSSRDWQFAPDAQLTLGKGFDKFFPIGPWIVTQDEIPNVQELSLRCWVDGELVQASTTKDMIFGVPQLLSFVSAICTLEVGDVIATGTPAGVGYARGPSNTLRPGQHVKCEIESVGSIHNEIA